MLWTGSGAVSSRGTDIWGGAGCRDGAVGADTHKAETHWRERREHPATILCCIVLLLDSSWHRQREIQRETLSKTVGGPGRMWSALTKKDFVLLGERECLENKPHRACCYNMGAT